MNKLEKYSSYKDSGVEWLGEIPEGWEIRRVKNIFNFSKGLTITKDNLQEEGIYCVNYGEIHSKYGFEINPEIHSLKCVDESYLKSDPKSLLNFGDFIFADTSEDIEGSGNFTHLNSNIKTFAGYHTVICRSKKDTNFRFFAYLFDSITYRLQIRKRVKGVKVYSITQGILKDTILWIPPKHEQTKIASFLDTKTEQLDKTISQKEKLIELLKERKQILINDAVTKGLNKDVEMTDSGVEWIEEIPKHWEIRRAKYLFKEIDERSKTGKEELLSVSHMTGVTPRSEKNVSMFMSEDYTGSKTCKKDDLVMNIMWAWMGALGVSAHEGIVSSSYAVYRQKNQEFNSKYIEYLLKTTKYIEHYNRVSTGLHSSRLRFYSHMFMSMKIGFPSIDEQLQILIYIEKQTGKIDRAIDLQQNYISKLKEYKATLIDSVVTGKVRVS